MSSGIDRIEQGVQAIGDPQHAHRDGRIAGAAEDGVDHEQQHDHPALRLIQAMLHMTSGFDPMQTLGIRDS